PPSRLLMLSLGVVRGSFQARRRVFILVRSRAARMTELSDEDKETAVAWAARQAQTVRDDPARRAALLSRLFRGPQDRAPRHMPFRRAAMSFIGWQANRGVLRPLDGDPPGSRWWRAVHGRLLLDGCEAVARAGGLAGEVSSPPIDLWMSFVAAPTGRNWYRAHNASIVSAYLEHRDLAELEATAERFFLNVALLRVLYAHAL